MQMSEFEICPDCSVAIGESHQNVCGISRCKIHGVQLVTCQLIEESDECLPTLFDGYFPGTKEATERGWHVYQNHDNKWDKCSSDHPDSTPDINRVMKELNWDSQLEKYV